MKRTRRPWTEDELALLRDLYPDMRTEDVARRVGRTASQVYAKANSLGLKKSEAFLRTSASGRFKPGQTSWNKGKKVGIRPGCAPTFFPKGHRPHNHKPIGSERVVDGYLQRKVTDTGYPPRDWRFVHLMVWEEHHGPVPPGHVVCFRNKNRSDARIENLELVSRSELGRRNSIHNWPAELKDAMRDVARLTREINKKTKNKEAANG